MLTAAEDTMVDHLSLPITVHILAYLTNLESNDTSPLHRDNVERCLQRIADDCGFKTLADLRRDKLEGWLVLRARDQKLGARTRNAYRAAVVAFCNWCVETDRLLKNPFKRVAKASEASDQRRKRRAMAEDELAKLLLVARLRPLSECGRTTIRLTKPDEKRKRSGWKYVPLTIEGLEAAAERARERFKDRPNVIAALEAQGRERALIYKTLVLTGLRKGELASLTVGQLHLDGPRPYAVLEAADEKNRQGSQIPLRCDLAADLASWLTEKLESLRSVQQGVNPACLAIAGLPNKLPSDTPLFNVPAGLVRILDRDLEVAGIPKRDDLGRTIDVHALRHSFGTLLSKGGVAPRTAQAAMRHSSIDLTMNVYTDPRLLDVHGALDALPALPLDDHRQQRLQATGTHDIQPSGYKPLVPTLVPVPDKSGDLGTIAVKTAGDPIPDGRQEADAASCSGVKRKEPLTLAVNGRQKERATGLEPATSSLPR